MDLKYTCAMLILKSVANQHPNILDKFHAELVGFAANLSTITHNASSGRAAATTPLD